MKRKIISTILAVIGIIIIGFATLFFLGLFKEQEAGVLIESEPVSRVFINGVEMGKTPYEANLKAGEINIKIKPEKNGDIVLDDYETKVRLVPGIRTIVKRIFKPDEEDSSGAIVSFEQVGGEDSYVTVVSVPDSSQITIDGKSYGYAPLRINIPAGDHQLVISSDKYLDKTLPIKVYKGYKLTASVKLARAVEVDPTAVPVVLPEATLNEKIRINKTDVGFLRVRSGASTGFPEVAQVKPDEVYEVIEEGEYGKWFKIKIGDTEGWVSAEFVTKI